MHTAPRLPCPSPLLLACTSSAAPRTPAEPGALRPLLCALIDCSKIFFLFFFIQQPTLRCQRGRGRVNSIAADCRDIACALVDAVAFCGLPVCDPDALRAT
eukprot:354786-Chlamydomonas_euryale.AAC.1